MAEITSLGGGQAVIHLTYLPEGSTVWRIACMPEVSDFTTSAAQPNYLRSNDTRAVTCQACKKTAIHKRVQEKER